MTPAETFHSPAVLEPHFDLFGLNVGKNWAFPDQLLAAQRTRFWALRIYPLQRLHLLSRVPDIFP